MEELLFPENYPSNFLLSDESNCLLDKFDKISPTNYHQEQIIVDDDDLFTLKQLHSKTTLNNQNYKFSHINDQALPIFDIFSGKYHCDDVKPVTELDGISTALFLPDLTIQIVRDKNPASLGLDTTPSVSSLSLCDQRLLTTTNATIIQQSNKHMMSKSTSSLSFCTQSSTSMTSSTSSIDEMSSNSNDYNDVTILHQSTESMEEFSHHQHQKRISENLSNISIRRRRKRTIFSAADIEHLKVAFIQNPKPTQQDIAILSEQLGHDSYVIRVWFYNKRQATKKTERIRQY